MNYFMIFPQYPNIVSKNTRILLLFLNLINVYLVMVGLLIIITIANLFYFFFKKQSTNYINKLQTVMLLKELSF